MFPNLAFKDKYPASPSIVRFSSRRTRKGLRVRACVVLATNDHEELREAALSVMRGLLNVKLNGCEIAFYHDEQEIGVRSPIARVRFVPGDEQSAMTPAAGENQGMIGTMQTGTGTVTLCF